MDRVSNQKIGFIRSNIEREMLKEQIQTPIVPAKQNSIFN